MIAFLFAFLLIAIYFYRHYSSEKEYWTRRGIPGPPPLFLLGNIRELLLGEAARSVVIWEWSKKYGKIFGIHDGQRKILVVSDMQMTEEILIKKFDHFHARAPFTIQSSKDGPRTHMIEARGLHWKRLRSSGTHAFTNKALKGIKTTVEASAVAVMEAMEGKEEVDVLEYYQEFTMDIITRIALGRTDYPIFANPYLKVCKEVFTSPLNNYMNVLPAIFPVLSSPTNKLIEFLGSLGHPFQQLMKDLEEAVAKRKKEREAGSGPSSSVDFIDMFLDAESEDSEDIRFGQEANFSRKLVFEEVVTQCMVMLLAGFETTSNSLSYLTYFLAKNPDVQQKCREEIEGICHDETVDYEELSNLKYTECAIKEALRLFPLASFVVTRQCVQSVSICGHSFVEGDMVATDSWALHRDPSIWGEDAEEFRPERWLEDSSRSRAAFQSFGEGPRMCIGMRLAYLEEKVALVHLLRRFDIHATERTDPLRLVGAVIVAPEKVLVRLEKRH